MPCRMYLRRDQSLALRKLYSSNQVSVFAPSWVKEALTILGKHLAGIEFSLCEGRDVSGKSTESFTITENFNNQSLLVLQKVARNEECNVTGIINMSLYTDIHDQKVVYSLRDLVRHSVVVGIDSCSACGGYGCCMKDQPRKRVYVCDLAALQFQVHYNSGRLVLVQKDEDFKGILDDLIFEKTVGERKATYTSIQQSWSTASDADEIRKRYIRHDGFGLPGQGSCFIDTTAYSAFVKADVVLTGLAVSRMVQKHHPEDKIHFKFLKYGTGFFAWKFAAQLEKLILSAVLDGLDELFQKPGVLDVIKCVELPFYKANPADTRKITAIKSKYSIEVKLSQNDALQHSHDKNLYVATTNCGDNHAPCGNEMGYGSVDAAIAQNLESAGNLFSPHINLLMSEEYIDV